MIIRVEGSKKGFPKALPIGLPFVVEVYWVLMIISSMVRVALRN